MREFSDSLKKRVERARLAFQMPQVTYPGRIRLGSVEYAVTQIVTDSDGTVRIEGVVAAMWEARNRA